VKNQPSRIFACIVALATVPVTIASAQDGDVDNTCVFVPIEPGSWSFKDGLLRISVNVACEEDYHLPRPLVWKPRQQGEKLIFGIEIPAQHCAPGKISPHHYEYTGEQLGLNEPQRKAVESAGESLFSPLTNRQAYVDLLSHAREREAAKEHPNPAILKLKPCAEPPRPKSSD
jgi:hypothetical protein